MERYWFRWDRHFTVNFGLNLTLVNDKFLFLVLKITSVYQSGTWGSMVVKVEDSEVDCCV